MFMLDLISIFALVMLTGTEITTNSNQPLQQPLDHLVMFDERVLCKA